MDWVMLTIAIFAVLVALFGGKLIKRKFSPKLMIRLSDIKGEFIDYKDSKIDTKACYFHLKVYRKNDKWGNNAIDTQICLIRLEQLSTKEDIWYGEIPMQWKDSGYSNSKYKVVGPAAECDLFRIFENNRKLILCLQYHKNNLQYEWTGDCDLLVTFRAKYKESVSDDVSFNIKWDGNWEFNKMENHVEIKEMS